MSEYKKLTEADLEEIAKIVPRERILWADEVNEEYSHDELSAIPSYPDLVVRATSAEEISKVLKYANQEHIAVTPRGAGTGLVGASVAVEHGIMMDTTLMNHFLELDEENLTLTLEPGVLLMEIYQYVEPKGLFYPPDPGEKTATIGGNISTNAGGMRAVKYGVTRDFVRGLEVVLADGTILELGGKVVKNSSGYDLKDLIIGSEGTLAFITKAILKLLPLPQKAVSLLENVRKQLSEFEVMILGFYLDGLTCREIAAAVGRSPKSVDNAVQRIRRKVARQLSSGDISKR